ncbi:MAG TPA: DnaJ C-terminal domain-containing protein [Alphaproteobacteria bacterium]|nr:DnaJ C-terminal domain-containing protein [Alphaproteobacteria bacterium]
MDDPYKVLGVARDAAPETIRAAYRKLAKQHHPDLNPGRKDAEDRFKAISAAYELLSDPEKRKRFDRGEIDASGAERAHERNFYRDFADAPGRAKYRAEAFTDEDLADLLGGAFRAGRARDFKLPGGDAFYTLTVDFLEAVRGAVRRLTLPDGQTLDVTIPAGLRDGQILRLKGKGQPGLGGGPPGDALIEVTVAPHPFFRRDGNDIILELPVTLKEAVLGGKVQVPTIKGPVSLTIPPNSSSGTRLRLKGRGIAGGHQYAELKVVIPASPEPELAAFLETWTPRHPFDPRKGMAES